MELIRNISAFFAVSWAFFKKWFLPYAYPPDEEPEDEDQQEAAKASQLAGELKPAAALPQASRDHLPPADASTGNPAPQACADTGGDAQQPETEAENLSDLEPADAVLRVLTLSNARTPRMLAGETGHDEEACKTALEQLRGEGKLREDRRGAWQGLTPDCRRRQLTRSRGLGDLLQYLYDDDFREQVINCLLHLLDTHPAALRLEEHVAQLDLQGKHVGSLLFYGNSITLELNAKVDEATGEHFESAGCVNMEQSPDLWSWDWPPYADHDSMQAGFDNYLRANRRQSRRRPRKRGKSKRTGAQSPQDGQA